MNKQKTFTIRLSEEEHKEAKIVAAKEGKPLKEIFWDAIIRLRRAQENKNG